jgi:short-subunit dehydrogenase
MFKDIKGKRILLTGASRGIGVSLARAFAEKGGELILAARDTAKLNEVAEACRAFGTKVTVIACDVGDEASRERLLRAAGDIDLLVNNAGVETPRNVVDQSDAEVAAQIAINLVAPIALCRGVLPQMLARRSGVIVNVSSMSGKAATPSNAIYAATKFGLNGFTASLALELHGSGVHVGVVCPGFVSGAGMWADSGMAAPAMMREVTPEAVVRGTFRVIRGDGEVLVTPSPMRPMLALRELFPSIEGPMLRMLGIAKVLNGRGAHVAKRS